MQEVLEHAWVERLLGEKPPCTFSDSPERVLMISNQGFGLHLRRFQFELDSLLDYSGIAHALVDRAHHHRSVRDGTHPDVSIIRALNANVAAGTRRQAQHQLRPEIWSTPPYTLSFFYIPVAPEHLLDCDGALRGLLGLLEPSQVMVSELATIDNRPGACAQLLETLNVDKLRSRYKDSDIKAGTGAFCSWAGLVVFDGSGGDLSYFESLEIRLQFAWLKASFVRRWAELLLTQRSLQPDKLTRCAGEVTPLLRQTRRLIDATASTRDQELFDELVKTSELEREIAGAEEALQDVRAQIDLARGARRRRYDQTIEALLFILAVFQALPLFYNVPFVELTPWTLPIVLVVFGGLTIARVIKG